MALLERYIRQIPIIGEEGQKKLLKTTALVVGVGGLGSAVTYYLAAAGIGKLILVDHDTVSLSDLNRQILYTSEDLGAPKANVAAQRLKKLNPNLEVEAIAEKFSKENAAQIVEKADIIFDCLDNIETRLILDYYSWIMNKPLIHGGIRGLSGQVIVVIPDKTPCLRCFFRTPSETQGTIPVIGVTPGIIGLIEALEGIKLITGVGEVNAGKIIVFDGYSTELQKIEIKLDKKCLDLCGVPPWKE